MTRNYLNSVICTVLFFISASTFAQDSTTVQDFKLWTGISIEKSFLEDKLEASLAQEFRFDNDASEMDVYFTELGLKYKLENGLSFGGDFRFIRNHKKSGYTNERRFDLNVGYKYKFDRLSLGARFKFTNRSEIGVSRDEGNYPKNKYRLRLKADYNIKNWKLDPYFTIETFYATTTNAITYVDPIVETEKIAGFEKMRYTIGTKYKIADFMSVGAFYRIEREFKTYRLNYNTPATYYIGGVSLNFKL